MGKALIKVCDIVLRVVGGVSLATLFYVVKNKGTLEVKCYKPNEKTTEGIKGE